MSTEQPNALRLADDLDSTSPQCQTWQVSAELRRLHERVQDLEASQARVPLSVEYIRDIYAEESHWDMVAPYVIEFARSIEAAHGITQEKQG